MPDISRKIISLTTATTGPVEGGDEGWLGRSLLKLGHRITACVTAFDVWFEQAQRGNADEQARQPLLSQWQLLHAQLRGLEQRCADEGWPPPSVSGCGCCATNCVAGE